MENTNVPATLEQNFKTVIATGPSILIENKTSHDNAIKACESFVSKVNNSGGMTDALDAEANDILTKIAATGKKLNEKRTPITQMLTVVSKEFTTLEADIDPKKEGTAPNNVLKLRNAYAQKKLEEQRERERLAKLKLDQENEKASISAAIESGLRLYFNDHIDAVKRSIKSKYDSITLDNFVDVSTAIDDYQPAYSKQHFDKFQGSVSVVYISQNDIEALRVNIVNDAKYAEFCSMFKTEIEVYKQSILDLLPSRKEELEEEAERIRLAEIEAEKKRKELEAAASAVEAERIRKEIEENERKAKEEEAKRLAEVERRKAEEEAKLQAEKEAEEKRIKAEEEAKVQAEQANNLFANSGELFASAEPVAGKVNVVYEIDVLNVAGYLLIAQYYFNNEKPANLTVEKLEKKTFAQMRAFAEKMANDNEEFIKSDFLKYKEVAKTSAK